MLDLDQETKKKFINLLKSKQYSKLESEVSSIGNIDEQDPILIMFYASSKALNPISKTDDLIEASRLFEKVYLIKKNSNHDTPSNFGAITKYDFFKF